MEVLGVCVLGECVSVCVHGSLSGSPRCVCPGCVRVCVCAGVSVEVLGVCVLGECVSVCARESEWKSWVCVLPQDPREHSHRRVITETPVRAPARQPGAGPEAVRLANSRGAAAGTDGYCAAGGASRLQCRQFR